MKQLRFLLAWSILLGGILNSCDILEEDVLPSNDALFNVSKDFKLKPHTPFVLDLGHAIQTVEGVKFEIGFTPEKGELTFMDNSFLKYKPSEDFKEGSDSFSVEMFDTEGNLLDADTLSISMLSQESGIPCLNGAMADFVILDVNFRAELDPVINDGYCEDEVSEYELTILVEPKQGSATKLDGTRFVYEADSLFEGYDYFVYALEMVDNDQVVYYSTALVEIALDTYPVEDCKEDLFRKEKEVYIDDEELEDVYAIEIYKGENDCFDGSWEVNITEVLKGTAEVDTSQMLLFYYPSGNFDSIDYIEYEVLFDDGYLLDGKVFIYFAEEPEDNCAEAYYDHYTYYALPDSTTSEVAPFFANPAENDSYCSEDYELKILQQPDIGEATITDERQLKYEFFEELAGDFEVTIKYEICDEGKCDYEYIYLDVIQTEQGTACAEAYDDEYVYYPNADSLTNGAYVFGLYPLDNDQVCSDQYVLELLEDPEYGTAEVVDNRLIQYSMAELPEEDLNLHMKYQICEGGECDYAYINLEIELDEASTQCVETEADEYVYYAYPDSTTGVIDPYIFDPVENDHVCSEDYTLEILEEPDLGQISLREDKKMEFLVEAEFAGEKETTLKYKVCVGEDCEDAYVYFTIYK
jgi:hypothetical protein